MANWACWYIIQVHYSARNRIDGTQMTTALVIIIFVLFIVRFQCCSAPDECTNKPNSTH